MDIILVRYGDAARNGSENFKTNLSCLDAGLTEAGKALAHQLGAPLRDTGVQRIFSSDSRRAAHTAEILAEYTSAPVEIQSQLRDINMGRLFAASWEEIEREMPGYAALWRRHESNITRQYGDCYLGPLTASSPGNILVYSKPTEYPGQRRR